MSGRAGYDLGVEIGKLMEHKFITKPARIIALIGKVLGMPMLLIGTMVMILDSGVELFDGDMILPSFLIAIGGVALLIVLLWWALQIDKKHADKA